MRRPRTISVPSAAALLVALILAPGCGDLPPVPLRAGVPELAQGGPKAADMTVTSTDPTGAPQDTALDVTVAGSNFDQNAWVELGLGGVVTPEVRTNSTRFVNPRQLVANVTISATAEVGAYDVIVTSGLRKPGIGTEQFEVRLKGQIINPNATFTYSDVAPGATGGRIRGDGLTADGSAQAAGSDESVYDHGRCGVTSYIFMNKEGDATMDAVGSKGRDRNCKSRTSRSLAVVFGTPLYTAPGTAAAANVTGGHYTNVPQVAGLIAVGNFAGRRFRLMLRGSSDCDYLRYENREVGGFTGSLITVTRISSRAAGDTEDAWLAVPQANPDGRYIAFCEKGENADNPTLTGVYNVSFRIKVVQR